MYQYDYPRPAVTTDIVMFTIIDERLRVLLIKREREPFQGRWALPGGFVSIDEDLDDCAERQLAEKTGVTGVYLEQLYTSGAPARDPRGRVISVAYYALVPKDRLDMPADSDNLRWIAVGELPALAFDHVQIVCRAHDRLAAKLNYSTIALQFMPEQFTLSHLQRVYQAILGAALDKRNFRKHILALDCIEANGEVFREGKHRPAKLYQAKTPGAVKVFK